MDDVASTAPTLTSRTHTATTAPIPPPRTPQAPSATAAAHECPHTIQLPGIFNLRDVGGYPLATGGQIAHGRLYRSGTLSRLTPASTQALQARGIRTVIDLRRADEALAAPGVFTPATTATATDPAANTSSTSTLRYHLVPLNGDLLLAGGAPTLSDVYRDMLDRGRSAMRQFLLHLLAPNAWPALIHCTAGKDRTGVATALLLSLAGVPDYIIIDDYARSAAALTGPDFDHVRADAEAAGYHWATTPALLASPPEAMADTLHHLRRRYNGTEGYVRALGFRDRQIRHLRHALITS